MSSNADYNCPFFCCLLTLLPVTRWFIEMYSGYGWLTHDMMHLTSDWSLTQSLSWVPSCTFMMIFVCVLFQSQNWEEGFQIPKSNVQSSCSLTSATVTDKKHRTTLQQTSKDKQRSVRWDWESVSSNVCLFHILKECTSCGLCWNSWNT